MEPAKSEKPNSDSHPPPHCQEASIGYKNAVSKTVKIKKGHNFILSAMVPETIEAVVAQNIS